MVIQLVDIGGFSTEYINEKLFIPEDNQTPFAHMIESVEVLKILTVPSFVALNTIGTQLSSIGGVCVEYASALVPLPPATHVPL